METPRRSLVKALLWNMLGLMTMSIVGFIATGSLAFGGKLAVINTVVGLICYVIYERIWSRISWGRRYV